MESNIRISARKKDEKEKKKLYFLSHWMKGRKKKPTALDEHSSMVSLMQCSYSNQSDKKQCSNVSTTTSEYNNQIKLESETMCVDLDGQQSKCGTSRIIKSNKSIRRDVNNKTTKLEHQIARRHLLRAAFVINLRMRSANSLSIVHLFPYSSSTISFALVFLYLSFICMQIVSCDHHHQINELYTNKIKANNISAATTINQQQQPVALARTITNPVKQNNNNQQQNNQLNLIDHWKGCQLLGFSNATLNNCGYCVGIGTNLPLDYGQDCLGICHGNARLDCRGQCNGNHFIDECSNECIDDHDLRQGYAKNRDCRGLCLPLSQTTTTATTGSDNNTDTGANQTNSGDQLSTTNQQSTRSAYILDDCHSCRLQNGQTQSPYVDCAGQCLASQSTLHHLSQQQQQQQQATTITSHRSIFQQLGSTSNSDSNQQVKPFYATTMCDNQCVLFGGSGQDSGGESTGTEITRLIAEAKQNDRNISSIKTPAQVLNSCNRCKSDPELCDCHLNPKACGCGTLKQLQDNGCYRVKTISPTIVPSGNLSQLRLSGYFSRAREDIMCLFQHESNQQYSFPLEINSALQQQQQQQQVDPDSALATNLGSYVANCQIDLPLAGNYLFGLGSTQDDKVNLNVDNELVVYAYDQARVQLLSMTPARMLTFGEPDDVTLTFETGLQPLTQFPLKCALLFDNSKYIIIQNEDNKNPFSCVIKMASLDQQQQLAAAALLLQQQQQQQQPQPQQQQQQQQPRKAFLPLFSTNQATASINDATSNNGGSTTLGSAFVKQQQQQQQQQIENQQEMQQLLQRSRIVRVYPTLDGINPIVDEPFELLIVAPPPIPLPLTSFMTNDGLTMSIMFDRPVNLTSSIEAVHRRRASHLRRTPQSQVLRFRRHENDVHQHESSSAYEEGSNLEPQVSVLTSGSTDPGDNANLAARKLNKLAILGSKQLKTTSAINQNKRVQGIHLCAQLLSKKTLKVLRRYQLKNCIWPSRVQFIVELGKPVPHNQTSIRVTFNTGVISEHDQQFALVNERELSIDVKKIPLESLGLPLEPALALTGPNQAPPCGQFTLATHIWSPYGTTGLKFSWSVERVASIPIPAVIPGNSRHEPKLGSSVSVSESISGPGQSNNLTIGAVDQTITGQSQSGQQHKNNNKDNVALDNLLLELKAYVQSVKSANLIVDAQLLRKSALYKFQVEVTSTEAKIPTLSAHHEMSKIDFDAPVATIYSSNQLPALPLTNQQSVVLLAEINVPACALKAKQVGLYWQVSDARVQFDFDQTFSPIYMIKANSLPDNVPVAFRMNLFYGIRVKKYSIAGTVVTSLKAPPEVDISNGIWTMSIGQQSNHYIDLVGPGSTTNIQQNITTSNLAQYNYQWSCHDGKTAQPCYRTQPVPVIHRTLAEKHLKQQQQIKATTSSGLLLLDRTQQRQSHLRLPASSLETNAQLWFGLQLYDKLNPSQASTTEYTLVTVRPGTAPLVAVGPVFVGRGRSRTLLRNPLTGSVILPAHTQAIILGRIGAGSSNEIKSIRWHSANIIHPLEWTITNGTDNNEDEISTELHINADHQIPYSSFQIQLTACNDRDACSTASISVNVVPSVSQCRIDVGQHLSSNSFILSVEYCNIPLGLSPITYQIYLIDLAPITHSNAASLAKGNSDSNHLLDGGSSNSKHILINDDDDMNEADEAYLESRAQPLTIPQLTPLFQLDGINIPAIVELLSRQQPVNNNRQTHNNDNNNKFTTNHQNRQLQYNDNAMKIKFGAKVCDRFQYCRMFYSPTTSLNNQQQLLRFNSNNNTETETGKLESGQSSMIDQQVSIVSESLQSMLDQAKRYNVAGNSLAALSVLNNLMNVAERILISLPNSSQQTTGKTIREKLISISRANNNDQQYADNKNTRQDTIFDIYLDGDKNRNKITSQLNQSLIDAIQYGRQVLHRPFHLTDSGQSNLVNYVLNRIIRITSDMDQRQNATRLLAQITRKTIQSSSSDNAFLLTVPDLKSLQDTYESIFSQISRNNNQKKLRKSAKTSKWALFKSIRSAYKSLISAAALQLSLGDTIQFRYLGPPPPTTTTTTGGGINGGTTRTRVSTTLNHIVALEDIRISIPNFGSITVQFDDKLRYRLNNGLWTCKSSSSNTSNVSTTKCQSFILATTTFVGSSPHQSLDYDDADPWLRIPIIDIDLLSPSDGSTIRESYHPNYKMLIGFNVDPTFSSQQETTTTTTTGTTSNGNLSEHTTRVELIKSKQTITTSNNGASSPGSSPTTLGQLVGQSYKCYGYDETDNDSDQYGQWSQKSVTEAVRYDSHRSCWTNHLGTFALFRNSPSDAEILSFASLMTIAVILISLTIIIFLISYQLGSTRRR